MYIEVGVHRRGPEPFISGSKMSTVRALHVPFGHIWQLAMAYSAPNWKLANQMATLPEWTAMIPKMGYSTFIGSAWSAILIWKLTMVQNHSELCRTGLKVELNS